MFSCQYLFLTPSQILGSDTLIGSGTNCVDRPRLASSRSTIAVYTAWKKALSAASPWKKEYIPPGRRRPGSNA